MQAELSAAALGKLIGALQSCRQKKDLHEARHLHAYLRSQHLESHPVLGNFLVPMLVECGSLPDAQQAFDRLYHRREHSWTSLISGYIDRGDLQHAFCLYHNMQELDSIQPTRYTYMELLNACSMLQDPEQGHTIHFEVALKGLERDLHVGSTLVDMYTKCRSLPEARHVFDRLPFRDAVSWATLIAGYAEHGHHEEAEICFQQMKSEGITPDSVTYVCSLKACGTAVALTKGQALHSELTIRGLENEIHVGSSLVDMYGKCGLLLEARQVCSRLPVRNAVTWNALITGFAGYGLTDEVENCFQHMQLEGISPDCVTFFGSLKACCSAGAVETGRRIHTEIISRGLEREPHVGNTIVDMYTKCYSFFEANQVLEGLPSRDAVSWKALIVGYSEHGHYERVLSCFKRMQIDGVVGDVVVLICSLKACGAMGALETCQELHAETTKRGWERDVYVGSTLVDVYTKCGWVAEAHRVFHRLPVRNEVSWNTLIAGYAEQGSGEEVLKYFKQMQLEGLSADITTFALGLKACAVVGALETGREIHAEIRDLGLETNAFLASILVDMYGKCGSAGEGREVFDKVSSRDVVLWTAMIKAYGENHEGSMAVDCFEDMQKHGVNPDSVTFVCLLAACSHASLVLKGEEYFKLMTQKSKIQPTMDHYSCMVDLYARSGQIYEAERFVAAMQLPPSCEIILALLSACKIYGKIEMGEVYFQQLVEANQEDAAAYLLMEDAYANAGRWRDADRVEELRCHAKAMKKPGSAFMQVDSKLHEFVVGFSQDQNVLDVLALLSIHTKDKGYVPNSELISSSCFDEENKAQSFNFVDKCLFKSDESKILIGEDCMSREQLICVV